MTKPRRAYLDVDGRQVHLRTLGEGRPLLLLHQNAYSSLMWELMLPELAARGYQGIAVDLPGYGMSDPLPGEPTLADYGAVALAVLDALGAGGFDVLGQHLGASLALELAVDHGDRVGRAIGYGLFLPGGKWEAAVTAAAPPVYDRDGAEVAKQWEIRFALGGDARMAVRSLAANLEAGMRRHLGLLAMKREDHEALLRRLERPYLALSSPLDSFYEESRRAATLSRHVTFRDTGENGLFFPESNPALYASYVDEFLRQWPESEIRRHGRGRRPVASNCDSGH
jgi:pimeloyl-ACP methyl ester carboxylesterase